MLLTELERPFIVTSSSDRSIPALVRTIKQAEYDGARAFEVHLPLVGFPDTEVIRRITEVTPYPIYATCRRGRFYELLGVEDSFDFTEMERVELLVEAVEAGFDGVDIELDTFDPTSGPASFTTEGIAAYATDPDSEPAEITDNPDAVARQREVVEQIHDAGGDIMISCHTYTHLDPAATMAIGERIEARGADFAKIVGYDATMDDLLDTLAAQLRLNEEIDIPYALMAIGEVSRIHRPISPIFGAAWVFAQPELTPGGFHSWPLVENAREVLQRVDWRSAHNPHAGE